MHKIFCHLFWTSLFFIGITLTCALDIDNWPRDKASNANRIYVIELILLGIAIIGLIWT